MTQTHREREAFSEFGTGRLTYLEGLDGVRGLAVLAVLMFHGNWSWMSGGFLGVSLFFTLSGFLITSLLLCDSDWRGVSLRHFWSNRARRLLPAAWLTLGAVVLASFFLLDAVRVLSVRLDVLASVGQVANWRFLAAGESYSDLFGEPSPVLHFWSLAIEEQFYIVFPLVLLGAAALTRGRRGVLAGFLAILAIGSWALPVVFDFGFDRTYYGTDTRAGEMLAGAVLALVLARPQTRRRLVQRFWWRTGLSVAGVAALATTVIAWVVLDQSSSFFTSGGFAVVSMLSVIIVASAAVADGPIRKLTGWGPLRQIGAVSYAIYLFHWPIFVFLSERRTGLPHLPRFILAVTVTFLLALLSAELLERPVRFGTGLFRPTRVRPAFIAPVVVFALIAALLVLQPDGRRQTFDFESAESQLAAIRAESAARRGSIRGVIDPAQLPALPPADVQSSETIQTTSPPTTPSTTTTAPIPPVPVPTVSLFGDSVMLSLALLIGGWEQNGAPIIGVEGETELGCGLARAGLRKLDVVEHTRVSCDDWATSWPASLEGQGTDVAVVSPGQWELVEHQFDGDSEWRTIGDSYWDDYVRAEMITAHDTLAAESQVVIWLTVPDFGTIDKDRMPHWQQRSHDPAGVARLNQIVREVVAARPETARLVDLAEWMAPRVDSVMLRDDGIHYNWSDENDVIRSFLGPQIIGVWQQWWNDIHLLARQSG